MSDDPNNLVEFPTQRPRLEVNSPHGVMEYEHCADWKHPIDMVRELLRDIEIGKINPDAIFVGMRCDADKEGLTERHPYYTVGFKRLEILGLLAEYMREVP